MRGCGGDREGELEKIDLPRVADGLILGREGELKVVPRTGPTTT